ncbi:LysM peptidoglycan-binding domain-containing protein [Flavobacterium sp.]|uniref:LysM peptidoglycan-binding domain-containing protein n=1 Tax=Flavobacterium sp. TaxID=239 RepID=UPI00374FFDED
MKKLIFTGIILVWNIITYSQNVIRHTVLNGETKYSISKQYGITISELEKQNPQSIPDITVGLNLLIKRNFPKTDKIVAKNLDSIARAEILQEYINTQGKSNTSPIAQLKTDIKETNPTPKAEIIKEKAQIKSKLGIQEFDSNNGDLRNAIPIDNTFENKIISYLPNFDGNSWGYRGRTYYITIGNTISTIQKKGSHVTNIFTNEEFQFNEDDMDFTDSYNRDSDFSLRTIHIEKQTTSNGNRIIFKKLVFNATKNCLENQVYPLYETFEYKFNGNIETFEINSYKGGNSTFGFIAKSTYTKKNYLFVYQTTFKKLKIYDLSTLNITNKNIYNVNNCSIHSIIDDNVFLQFGDKILPVIIKTDIGKVLENSQIRLGGYDETLGWLGNIFSLWDKSQKQLKGFVNVFPEQFNIKNLNYKVKLYDKQFNLVWESTLSDIKITDIHESNGYLIIGGFTLSKGYVGFANPRIVVINKATKQITYDNVIPLKYGEINNISSDINGNIELTIDIWNVKLNGYKHDYLVPKIILDELDSNGKFVNNLFQ